MNILELNEQEIVRRNSLEEMRNMGIEPYPAAEYVVTAYSDDIKTSFTDLAEGADPAVEGRKVSVAGRIMSRRIMGKAAFMELQDSRGRIQVYVSRDAICPDPEHTEQYNVVFKKLL
ncbi:MAG: lysine--tRNA ligase, partial [Bacteroidales bacterium]|nr:lysine--tRNA ligase [Bacteroidales bacterium]